MQRRHRWPDTPIGSHMGTRAEHIGDVIRTLRQRRGLTAASLARSARVSLTLVAGLEQRGPDVEHVTPVEWGVLDRIAVTLGLRNGASLYKLVPDPSDHKAPLLRLGGIASVEGRAGARGTHKKL